MDGHPVTREGQRAILSGGSHRGVALDVVNPLLGEHLVESSIGDSSGVAIQDVLVGMEHIGAVALGVLPRDRGRISGLLLEHDYVPARDGALRGSRPGRKRGGAGRYVGRLTLPLDAN